MNELKQREEHKSKDPNEVSYELLCFRTLNDSITNFNYFFKTYLWGCDSYDLTKEQMKQIWKNVAADFMGWADYFNGKEQTC